MTQGTDGRTCLGRRRWGTPRRSTSPRSDESSARWGLLESTAHSMLQALLGLERDPGLYKAIRPRSFAGLIDAIRKVAELRLPAEGFKELSTTLKRISREKSGLQAQRNRINHHVWLHPIDPEGATPVTHEVTDQWMEDVEPFPLDDLKALASGIEECAIQLTLHRGRHLARSSG